MIKQSLLLRNKQSLLLRNKILFFTGVPLDDGATIHRLGLLARLLQERNYKVVCASVSANFQKEREKEVNGLRVRFLGQAHYFSKKPFSQREKLGLVKIIGENIKTCARLARLLWRERPERVLIVTTMPVSLAAGIMSAFLGFKTYLDIEDYALGQMASSGYSRFLVGIYSLIERVFLSVFEGVCVCSYFLAEKYPGSVIIPNMIETKFWQNEGDLRFKNKDLRIVFVGQMGPYHGQREVLEGLAPLLAKRKNLKLIFVGGGEMENKLKIKSEKLKIKDKVIFTGQVSQEKVREILTTCQIGILPLWNTPVHQARHPLKLLEYLAAGLVVVSNKVGEATRIVKDGENGILCPAGDIDCLVERIDKILGDKKAMAGISRRARETASQFAIEKILPKWIEFLEV